MPGRSYSSGSYRYGFQGQEMDDEIKGTGNSLNYKFRMHDPRVGRFLSIDPLAPKYPHNSPYVFSENVVTNAVELEGLERRYVYNSAWKSKQVYSKLETTSFREIKDYLNAQLSVPFKDTKSLNHAKKMLGEDFEGSNGYNGFGTSVRAHGDNPVRGSSDYNNNQDYLMIRLAIDNGDGTWSTQEVTVYNPEFIKKELKRIDKSLEFIESTRAEIMGPLARMKHAEDIENSKPYKPINTGGDKDRSSTNKGDAYNKIGKTVYSTWRNKQIKNYEERLKKLESWEKSLLKSKEKYEKLEKNNIKYEEVVPAKK